MAHENQHARELNEAAEVLEVILPADQHAAVVLEPGKEPFHLPAPLLAPQGPAILRRGAPVAAVRRDERDAPGRQLGIQRVRVVGPVANQSAWERRREAAGEEWLDERRFMRRSTGHVDGERKTSAICHGHDLRTFAPLGGSHPRPPFLAMTKGPSTKHSERSRWPRSRQSSAKA